MGKHGHEERKSTKEAKDSKPKFNHAVKSKGFFKLKGGKDNSEALQHNGKDKSVKSSSLIGSLMPCGLKEAQEMIIFALDHSHNKHKGHIKDCQLGNPCDPKETSNGSKSLPND
ncbi:hypothetical protein Tco_0385333 [Tanacetum coccineum]